MKKIRVGLIRCDTHACWYGLLFAPVDEFLLLKHWHQIHAYFYHKHKNRFGPYYLNGEKAGPDPGFELTRIWDEDRKNAEKFAEVFLNRPQICDTLDEVSDDVDLVFLSDCYLFGEDHLELAAPGLEKGVPTFVDKPFAHTLADARAIVDLAQQNDAPVMSASLLGVSPLTEEFRRAMAEIAPIGEGIVKGMGGGLNAIVHNVGLAHHAFGEGVEYVECMGSIPLEFMHWHYPSSDERNPKGTEVIVLGSHTMGPNNGYHCVAYSHERHHFWGKSHVETPWINDYNFPIAGIEMMNKIRVMVETGEPPISYASQLEVMELIEAGKKAQETKSRVYLEDIRSGK